MKLKKILVVPPDKAIVGGEMPLDASLAAKFLRTARRALAPPPALYDGELQFYSDIPKVLGRENVYVFGKYHRHFHSSQIPENCPYPSCHGTPEALAVMTKRRAEAALRDVEAVFVSTRAGERRDFVISEARRRNLLVALFDIQGHANYSPEYIKENLYRGFKPKEHFDLYFKADLPLGYANDVLYPCAPTPVRPEMYRFVEAAAKDRDIFYSGRWGPVYQADRQQTVTAVKEHFPDSIIAKPASRKDFMGIREYWQGLSRSRMALSPSGIVWDSFRHCEVGLAKDTLLIAPKPYLETAGPPLEDGVNALLYDVERRGSKYYLKNTPEFVEKIRHYLNRPEERERIARRWAQDVRLGHTVYARSKYMVERIESSL